MLASNQDVLEYHFERKPVVNILRTDKYDKYFTTQRQYSGATEPLEKGWIYAALGTREMSSFVTLGFDGTQRYLFNEIRYKNKTYPLGEGFCNTTTTFGPGRLEISDALRELRWKNPIPNYDIELKAKVADPSKPYGEITLHYSFEEISPDIGKYRCIYQQFDKVLAYWMISPAKGTLSIDSKGDTSSFKLGEAEDLIGKTISSKFAYNENIHFQIPMIGEGWNWTILGCFKNQGDEQPSIFISFMEQSYLPSQKAKIPLFTQLYVIDLDTGASELYNDAQAKLTFDENATPILEIATPQGEVEIKLGAKSAESTIKHQIRGIKMMDLLFRTDYDYTTFPSIAKVKLNGKEYDAIGTSEVTGAERFCYWI